MKKLFRTKRFCKKTKILKRKILLKIYGTGTILAFEVNTSEKDDYLHNIGNVFYTILFGKWGLPARPGKYNLYNASILYHKKRTQKNL